MSQITEITWIPFKYDAMNSESVAALKKLGPELAARPGLDGSWHGATIERPLSAEIVNVWSSEEAYKASQSSSIHATVTDLIKSIVETALPNLKPFHTTVILHKPVETLITAPIVQITNIFLPTDVDKAAFDAAWEGLVSHMRANPPDGFIAGAHGWGLEDVNGAKVFTALSGWEDLQKNIDGQEAIRDKVTAVQEFSNVFDVHHTSFKKVGEE